MHEHQDGAKIAQEAVRYYHYAYQMYKQGYHPAFVKDLDDGSMIVKAVKVEPFVPKDMEIAKIEKLFLRE